MHTYCVGRFLIDAPPGAKPQGNYGLRIASIGVQSLTNASPEQALGVLDRQLENREGDLRAQLMPQGGGTRFLGLSRPGPASRAVHYMTPGPEPDGRADGYVVKPGGMVFLQTSAYEAADFKVFSDFIAQIEPTLSIRAETDIPKVAGFCIDNGFVAYNPPNGENVNTWGWTVPGHPDAYFSFTSRTNGKEVKAGIVDREASILREAGARLMQSIKTLRKRRFDLGGMQAQEWSRVTTDDKPQIYLDIEIPGQPNDNAAPAITLSMSVGGYGEGGYHAPSLSEGEALALWDRVISTLRLRPGAVK